VWRGGSSVQSVLMYDRASSKWARHAQQCVFCFCVQHILCAGRRAIIVCTVLRLLVPGHARTFMSLACAF